MNRSTRTITHGDRISALGITCTVDQILYQDHFGDRPPCPGSDCWGFDVEFTDTLGRYHHWKQNQDGGAAFRWNGRHWLPIVPDDEEGCPVPGSQIRILQWYRNEFGFTAWIERWPAEYQHLVKLKIFNSDDYKIWESQYTGPDAATRARIDLITRAAGVWTED